MELEEPSSSSDFEPEPQCFTFNFSPKEQFQPL